MNDVAPQTLGMPALLNRERAILEFNRRVLAQARRPDVPLLERLRYVCIVSSNLDEFFEVRFADMLDAQRDGSGLVTPRDVERVGRAAHDLIDLQYAIFNDQVMPVLREHMPHLFDDDPNLTDTRFPGNKTASYRSVDPLIITGEVKDWAGHSAEQLRRMKDSLARMSQEGSNTIIET